MNYEDKIIQQVMNEAELADGHPINKNTMKEIVLTLADAGVDEESANSAIKKYSRDMVAQINNTKLAQGQKDGWLTNMVRALNSAIVEAYPPVISPKLANERMRKQAIAEKSGYGSYDELEVARKEDKVIWNEESDCNALYAYDFEAEKWILVKLLMRR